METAASAASAVGAIRRSVAATPSSRIAAKAPASTAMTIRASSAVDPWPGSRTAHQAIALAAARPTTGATGESLRAPARARIPAPSAVAIAISPIAVT